MSKFVSLVLASASAIEDGRTAFDVLEYTMTEVGELAEEVIIASGRSRKSPGTDGVAGEAADMAICLLDLLRLTHPHDVQVAASDMVELSLEGAVKGDLHREVRAIAVCLGTITDDIERHGMSTGLLLKALGHVVRIVRIAMPEITDSALARMAQPKLEKWAGNAAALAKV